MLETNQRGGEGERTGETEDGGNIRLRSLRDTAPGGAATGFAPSSPWLYQDIAAEGLRR